MKYNYVVSVLLVIAVVFGVRERMKFMKCRSALVHYSTTNQMDKIQNRAQHFIDLKLDGIFLSTGGIRRIRDRLEHKNKEYEIVIGIPEEKTEEFREWMKSATIYPVVIDNWPSSSGSSTGIQDGELYYRVFYGSKPKDWKQPFNQASEATSKPTSSADSSSPKADGGQKR